MSEGFYKVHSCEPDNHCDEECDAVFVWSQTELEAITKTSRYCSEPRDARVSRFEEADKHREALGDLFGNGYGKHQTDREQDKIYRELGFREDGAPVCMCCSLAEWHTIPESKVCEECECCSECGCSCEAVT